MTWLPAVIVVALARRRLFSVTVEGASMEPALRAGDRLLARRAPAADLRPGQIVIIEKPVDPAAWHWPVSRPERLDDGHWMIKRVAAVPGDAVPPEIAAAAPHLASPVPPGAILVLGDNRAASIDSRELGPVPADRVLGVAIRDQ